MEVPVRMEHLRLCHREDGEAFDKYVLRLRSLISRMRDTPDLKEVVKICAMNAGLAAFFLTSASCTTFDDLFDMVSTFE